MRAKINLPDGKGRGYIQEIFCNHYKLPELGKQILCPPVKLYLTNIAGPLGGSGLASQRDFQTPTAYYEETEGSWEIHYKVLGHFFRTTQQHSPFDVVAWHGNYVPFKVRVLNFSHS